MDILLTVSYCNKVLGVGLKEMAKTKILDSDLKWWTPSLASLDTGGQDIKKSRKVWIYRVP